MKKRTEMQKKKSFISLANKFHKKFSKKCGSLAGAHEQKGYTCICDGFIAFRFKKSIDYFEGITAQKNATPLNFDSIIPNKKRSKEVEIDLEALEMQYNKYKTIPAKERKDKPYQKLPQKFFEIKINDSEIIYLNIEFLMTAHNILDFNCCKFYANTNVEALRIEDQQGNQGLVLPIMPPN